MWKHEIINCVRHLRGLPLEPKISGIVNNAISKSNVFYFGDQSDYFSLRKKQGGIIQRLPERLPFSIILCEYGVKENPESIQMSKQHGQIYRSSRRVNLLVEADAGITYFFNFVYYDHFKQWGLYPFMMWAISNFAIPYIRPVTPKAKYEAVVGYDLRDEFTNTALMLQILNARNIVTRTVTPPEKLNKARVKRKQPPLYEYKILEVVKGAPKNKDMGRVPWDYKSPSQTAFHMCRGHFKTYTEDAPLFGKYAGTFWWQPQARGSKENGVIEKEYAVTMANG